MKDMTTDDAESRDPEINAIAAICAALQPFDHQTRARMLNFVVSWAHDPKTQRCEVETDPMTTERSRR